MAQDKRIGVSVDDSGVSRLRQSANDLARDMIRSSRAYSTSSKEVLRDIEEQIRLIEKRNKLDEQSQRTSLMQQKTSGAIDASQYKQGLQQVSASSREDKLQVELLRELIDTVKSTAKEEIRSDRQTVEKTIRRDKSLDKLGISGDPEQALRRTIQRGILGEVGEEEVEERRKFKDFSRGAGSGANRALSTVAGSQNELYMAAAALALIPVMGQGLSMVGNRFISSADQLGKATGSLAGLRGTSVTEEAGIYTPESRHLYAPMGLNPAEAAQKMEFYQRPAALSLRGNDALNLMAAERAFGLDAGSLRELSGIGRYSRTPSISVDGVSSRNTRTSNIIEILRDSSDKNNAVLQELLGTFNQTSNRILSVSGQINTDAVAAAIGGIKEITGFEGRQLDRSVDAIQGLGQSRNPVARTMMARAFREAMPEATWFETRAAMENPLEHTEALSSVFKNLERMTGGGELYQNALYEMFGGKLSYTDITQLEKGETLSSLQKKKSEKNVATLGLDYTKQAGDFVWEGEKATKRLEAIMQTYGKDVVDFTSKLIGEVNELAKTVFSEEKREEVQEDSTDYKKMEDAVARGVKRGVKDAQREG